LEICKESPYNKKKVIKQREESYIEYYNDYCSSGWYVLYCCQCERVCHRDCRGPNEGLHSNEYGCDAIGTFSCKCSYCGCHYGKHSFHDYIEKSRNAKRKVDYDTWVDDPDSIAIEEEKAKKREEINKDIQKQEIELKKIENDIHDSLNESINKLYEISNKDKDLNKIALKKYKEKNGFCKKILNETIKEDKIRNIFNKTLDDIESICSSEEQKEQSIINIQNLLNSSF